MVVAVPIASAAAAVVLALTLSHYSWPLPHKHRPHALSGLPAKVTFVSDRDVRRLSTFTS